MTSLFLNTSVRKYFGLCYHMCTMILFSFCSQMCWYLCFQEYFATILKIVMVTIVQLLFRDGLVSGFPVIPCSSGFWKLWWILSLSLGLTFVVLLGFNICPYFLPCLADVSVINLSLPLLWSSTACPQILAYPQYSTDTKQGRNSNSWSKRTKNN